MKKLAVPFFEQKIQNDCMVACMKMLLDYYGVATDYDEDLKEFLFNPLGLSMPQIGRRLLSKGLKTQIETLNPHLFTAFDIGKSQEEILEVVKSREFQKEQFKIVHGDFLEYMQDGGVVVPSLITKQTIIDAIDNETPVLVILTTRVLGCEERGYNFHANLIYGYDERNFFVHDPAPLADDGGSFTFDQDLFLHAILIIGFGDVDNASIMKVIN